MTYSQVRSLIYNQTIFHVSEKNADGSPLRARVSGKLQVWKRSGKWRLPLKHGLYTNFALTPENMHLWLIEPERFPGPIE